MLSESIIQYVSLAANLIIILFLIYYFFKFRAREKEIEKKENKIDTQYHHIVNTALAKERQILDDAAHEADQIITGAHYIRRASTETVDKALQRIVDEIQKEAIITADSLKNSYGSALKNISDSSLNDLQSVANELETDLRRQIRQFSESFLPALEKEIEQYKQSRMKQAEQLTETIVRDASQEILNKSIALEDHQKLVIESLEKAKNKGIFD